MAPGYKAHEPTGFDYWSVCPRRLPQPRMITKDGMERVEGYVTDVITDLSINWLEKRDESKPFFLMCHHKAPHREWDPKPEHRSLYLDPIPQPETFDDDYSNRAQAAADARMRIARDMHFKDLDLVGLPEYGGTHGLVPFPDEDGLKDFSVRCMITGELFTFESLEELADFKYQRYMRKYLQCVHSVDENVGRLLDWLDEQGLADNTIVIYPTRSYKCEHGWFDKRLVYEESFQRLYGCYPAEIKAGNDHYRYDAERRFYQNLPGLRRCRRNPTTCKAAACARSLPVTHQMIGGVAHHRYGMNADGGITWRIRYPHRRL